MECIIRFKKRPKFIDAIEKFQLSGAYPVFFAILCTISGLGNKYVYLPVISVLALSILFSVLFVRDNRVFITPIFMIYYSLGSDSVKAFFDSNGNVIASFDTDGFIGICILAAIISIPFFSRFIIDGSIAYTLKNRGVTFWGMVALNIAILLGGAFSPEWSMMNLAYGLIIVVGLDVFYLILSSVIRKSDDSIVQYVFRVLFITCLLVCVQALFVVLRLHLNGLLIRVDIWTGRWILQREYIAMSWGIVTLIGAVCATGIPAAMYLAQNGRFPLFYYISALFMWGTTILINTRSAMIVGGAFLIIGGIIISLSGKNKKVNLIFSSALLTLTVIGLVSVYIYLSKASMLEETLFNIYKFLRFDMVSNRIESYKIGISNYLSAPLFGVGWSKGGHTPESQPGNFYSNMYHCFVIQMGASAGSVGIIALLIHLKDIIILSFKNIKIDRLFIVAVPIVILLMSLVDNFFFYLNFQIFYVAFLTLAEKHLESTKKELLNA